MLYTPTFKNLKIRSPLQKKVSDCKVATRDAFHLAATPKMHVLEHTGCPSMIWVNFKQQEVSITLTVKRAATVYANFYTLDHSYLKSENKKKINFFSIIVAECYNSESIGCLSKITIGR